MALPPRQRGGRPTASQSPGVGRGSAAGGPPSAGADAGADAGEQPKPRRRPLRRPAKRGGSDGGIPPVLIRVGIVVAILLIGGVVKMATAKPAGDVRYFNALADLTQNLHRNPFANIDTIRQKITNLPVRDVTDPMLKEMHSMLVQFMDMLDQADDTPDFESRLNTLGQRIDKQIDRLNAKYGH